MYAIKVTQGGRGILSLSMFGTFSFRWDQGSKLLHRGMGGSEFLELIAGFYAFYLITICPFAALDRICTRRRLVAPAE